MPAITLKNMPQSLLEQLRASAAAQHRSVNGEILSRLEASFARGQQPNAEALLAHIDSIREQTPGLPPLTDEMLWEARHSGRP